MFTKNSALLSTSISKIITDSSVNIGSLFDLSFSQLIKNLFANNEQGFVYDPNDLSTMFQDAAGTVPVTGVGQAVGLMLDKSKGLVLGTEIVTSFGLSKSTNAIESGSDGILNYSDGILTLQRNATDAAAFLNSSMASLDVNKFYKLKFRVVSGQAVLKYGVNTLTNLTANEYTLIMRNTSILRFWPQSVGSTIVIDNISVKELAGNHAYQTVSASRPILQRNATTGANYLEFDGADDFLQTNNIDFTATNKVSLFAGVRKMPATTVNMLCELSSSSTDTAQANAFYLAVPETPVGTVFFRSRATPLGGQVAMVESGSGMRNCVITAKSDIPNDLNTVSIDGVLGTPSSADLGVGNLGNYPLYIGRRGGISLPFNGHIYSLIGIGRLTTDNETIALEKSIAKNVGVTLNV